MKAPIVKQKSFELERKGERFFSPANRKRGQMDYPSLLWKMTETEQRIPISARKRPRSASCSKQLRPALITSTENYEIGQMDNRNQTR